MDPTLDSIQTNLDSLAIDLKKFENELLPQIEGLAEAIPEIYAKYASVVRNLVNTTLDLFKPSQETGNKIALAAEVGARSIEAYGEYKAAIEHNRLLKKFMAAKKAYASTNLGKIQYLLPLLTKSNSKSAKLFQKCAEIEYQINNLDNAKLKIITDIQKKVFSMHRTNIYLLELCKYLVAEYKVWLSDKQKSDNDFPDYYLINSYLAKYMFGENLLQAYSDAADETAVLTGKQIMLLSDYQLSMMALGTQLCKVNLSEANPVVERLISECGACKSYTQHTEEYASHIEKKPAEKIIWFGLLAVLAIIFISFIYLDNSGPLRWVLSIGGSAVALRICLKGYKTVLKCHVQEGITIAENCDKTIENACGKVDRPDIDYNERNALSAAINGFFN